MEQLTMKTVNLQKKHLFQMPAAELKEMEKGQWLCWVKTDKGSYFVIFYAENYYILRKANWKPVTEAGTSGPFRVYFTTDRGTAYRSLSTEDERDRWLAIYNETAPTVDQVYI